VNDPRLQYIIRPRALWREVYVTVSREADGAPFRVCSLHRTPDGTVSNAFSIEWAIDSPRTEYEHGMSVIHDIKDHYFYGLGITPLSEFQTIVQTYFGRVLIAGSRQGRERGLDTIREAISDELFGPRGARVYDPSQRGLLETYLPNASTPVRDATWIHMRYICEEIMLPALEEIYKRDFVLLSLQAPIISQPELVEYFLPNLRWDNEGLRTLRLAANIGWTVTNRAYTHEGLLAVTQTIQREISGYVRAKGLEECGAIFDVTGYAIA
jgi:hypothetical protein